MGNKMASQKLILGLVGMPGSGKSVVVSVAKERNYDVVVMGDVVRGEAKNRGLEPSPENLGKIMLELREKEGDTVIAKRCISKIERAKETKVIVDGIRSLKEAEEFRKHFPKFCLTAVHSSPETRFNRVYHRKRSDDPSNWKVFHERDMRELSVGLGEALAMAEYLIINEERLDIVKERTRKILSKVEEKWMT